MRKLLIAVAAAFLFFRGLAVAQDVYVDNVVIVLDSSGSMDSKMSNGNIRKIDAAKLALKEVLKTIPQSTHVGLLVFSAGNTPQDWVYPLGPRNDQKLMEAIDLPQPNNGTPLGTYLKIGADRLLKARKDQYGYGSYRLLVVTDGEADTGGEDRKVEEYVPDIISRGIIVDVIGVNMSSRHTLATKVNSYRSANDPKSLKQAVQEVFAEISKDSKDSTGEDAFEAIAPLPESIVLPVLNAFSSSGNHPIGEKSEVKADSHEQQNQANGNEEIPPFVKGLLVTLGILAVVVILFVIFGGGDGY